MQRKAFKINVVYLVFNTIKIIFDSTEVPEKLSRLMKALMRHHVQIEKHYILVLILRLRQMCCHPGLIKAMLDEDDKEYEEHNGLQFNHMNPKVMEELEKLISDDEDDSDDDEYSIDERMAKRVMSKANPVFKDNRRSSKVYVLNV